MEQPSETTASQEQARKLTVGRRRLIKVIAATGGAAAASFLLPGKWFQPVIDVGVLPAHAQVSSTTSRFSLICDSTPGGGDISIPSVNFIIRNIQPQLVRISGTGSVQGIAATMTAQATSGALPTFSPTLPQFATTGPDGRAHFPDLTVTPGNPTEKFNLVFTFAPTTGTTAIQCGTFQFES